MNIFDEQSVLFFQKLSKNKVRYILVGGLAVNHYGFSRTTGDIDIWIEDSSDNRKKLVATLNDFGVEGAEAFLSYPLVAGFAEILLDKGIYIDLMADLTYFKKENFGECFEVSESLQLSENLFVKVIHINHLITEKEKSGRPKDKEDLAQLKIILEKRLKN